VKFDTSKLEAGGDYSFFCTFPGHISMMKGKVIVK
jgi:azurin